MTIYGHPAGCSQNFPSSRVDRPFIRSLPLSLVPRQMATLGDDIALALAHIVAGLAGPLLLRARSYT